MPLSRSRDYLSIGEVLDTLRDDFPDISISKIRFLEAEGLISPERTESGYRKFYDRDLARLRYILSLQSASTRPTRTEGRCRPPTSPVPPGAPRRRRRRRRPLPRPR